MSRKLRANPKYRKKIYKQRNEFENIVKDVTREKVRELRFMSTPDRQRLVQNNHLKLKELATMQAQRLQLDQLLQARIKEQMGKPKAPPKDDEESLRRIEWSINLREPLDQVEQGGGLSIDEVTRLAHMMDMDKYPEFEGLQLPQRLYFAKWLASEEIYNLILDDKLIAKQEHHLNLLTQPTDNQMRRLSLLAHFIKHDLITVDLALETFLDEDCYNLLDNPEFKNRAKTFAFSEDDKDMLDRMGIKEPRQRLRISSAVH